MPRIYQRGGVWQADCYYVDEGRRKRIRRSTGVHDDGTRKTQRTALQIAREIEASIAAGQGRKGRTCTVRQAIICLLRRDEVKGNSDATMRYHTEKGVALVQHFGKRDVESITEADMIAYAHRHIDSERDGRRITRHTVQKELRTLREAYRAARSQGWVEGDPPPMPDLGTYYVPRVRWLTVAERRKLIAAMSADRRDYVVAYLRGIDPSELERLTAADVDFAARRYRVRGTKTRFRDRALPLDPEMEDILRRRCRARPHGPLFEPWANDDRDIKRACKRAGIEPCSPKDLRRSFATDLARAGTPRKVAQKLMGHGDGRMLDKVYEQFADEDLDAAAQHFEQLRRPAHCDVFVPSSTAYDGDNGLGR